MAQLCHGFRPVRAATGSRDHHFRGRIPHGASCRAAVVRRVLGWLQFERLALRTGASEMLRVADMPSAELLIAKIVFWIVWIGFIVSALDTLQFGPFQGLVEEFFRFVPRSCWLCWSWRSGFLVGNFLWRATLLASVNAGLPGARLLSGTLRLLVIAIAVVMALEQLGLATAVVLTAFAITFGALMLGLAIAFGLGGRDAARSCSSNNSRHRKQRDTDAAPHL